MSTLPTPIPSTAPTLPKSFDKPDAHDALLRDWLSWQGDFFALAAEHGLTLDQLIAWFRSDATQHRLSELAALADARAFLLAKLHRSAAITRLTEIVEDTRTATIKDRTRAATQLLRTAKLADDKDRADQRERAAPILVAAHGTATVRERSLEPLQSTPHTTVTEPATRAAVSSPGRSTASQGNSAPKHIDPSKRAKVPETAHRAIHLNGRAA